MIQPFSLAVHGGAGTLVKGQMTAEKESAYKKALELALDEGYALLKDGASAVDAVERAVTVLEDSPSSMQAKAAFLPPMAPTKWMRPL